MNRIIAGLILVVSGFGGSAGLAQDRPPTGRPVAALEPGMTWHVESLPASQRVLETADGDDPTIEREATDGKSGTLIEENVIGNGFRMQKKISETGPSETRLFQKDKIFVPMPDGRGYAVDFQDSERPGSVVGTSSLLEFDWVSAKWWIGVREVDGVECDVYGRPWLPVGGDDPADDADLAVAPEDSKLVEWVAIARADRFPRRWESRHRTFRYKVLPKVVPQNLPPAAAEAARELEERLERQANRYRIPQ